MAANATGRSIRAMHRTLSSVSTAIGVGLETNVRKLLILLTRQSGRARSLSSQRLMARRRVVRVPPRRMVCRVENLADFRNGISNRDFDTLLQGCVR